MTITKLGHSSLLLEEKEARILIDPGNYVFMENKDAFEEMKNISAIFITHEHVDHLDLESFPKILKANKNAAIYTNESVAAILKNKGINSFVLDPGDQVAVGDIKIRGVDCPHGLLAEGQVTPKNIGFLFNEKLFHPGDCIVPLQEVWCEILALPVSASWLAHRDAVDFAKKLRPKITFPIHDAIVKYPDLVYTMTKKSFDSLGLNFQPLHVGETFK